MFAKLLKYEWKSTSAILGILSLCVLGVGMIGGGALRLLIHSVEQLNRDVDIFMVPLLLSVLLMMGAFLAIAAYSVGAQIMLFYRFYKSRFTDEGYLTFTLPVTASQIFWSSFTVIVSWILITTILSAVSFFLLIFLGTLGTEAQFSFNDLWEFGKIFRNAFAEVGYEMGITMAVSLISLLTSTVFCMTAVTVGSVIAKKHKLLAAIGVYMGSNTVMGIITGIFSAFATILAVSMDAAESAINFIYIVQLIFSIALASGACVLDIYLMKNKLNLP